LLWLRFVNYVLKKWWWWWWAEQHGLQAYSLAVLLLGC